MIKNADVTLTFHKSQKSYFLELFECKVKYNRTMKFGVLIIWDAMVTLRPFVNSIFVLKNTTIEK